MLCALLLATPSVPRATLTPSSSMRGTGAKPLASFMLLAGLQATVAPRRASTCRSSSSHHTQWAARTGESNTPHFSKKRAGVRPPWRCLHSSCSRLVSERCTWTIAPRSRAMRATSRQTGSLLVYSAWMHMSALMRPSAAPFQTANRRSSAAHSLVAW